MSPVDGWEDNEGLVDAATAAFGLGHPENVTPLGGTATPKFDVRTPRGRFVVSVRQPDFASENAIAFDHHALGRLAAAGLPVPSPQRQSNGMSFLRVGERTLEVLSWIDGELFSPGDRAAISDVGRFLARLHAALGDDIPPGKEHFLREDHPDLLAPYVDQLTGLCRNDKEAEQVRAIGEQIALVRETLDNTLWPGLPKGLVHGDIQPGNLRFRDSRVAAVYDFDYLGIQARVHDICHALIFFASRRDAPVNPNDIRSLTQPFTLDAELCRVLLGGYQEVSPLVETEWWAMIPVIRSQWLQFRLRGGRKVPTEEKVAYVLDRFFEVLDWLDYSASDLFKGLRGA